MLEVGKYFLLKENKENFCNCMIPLLIKLSIRLAIKTKKWWKNEIA